MTEKQLPWIRKGYNTFALEGPAALKVERLSKNVGKNKSSFYHHFSDLDVFTNILLTHHTEQAEIMSAKEAACSNQQDFMDVIIEHKIDLLFNRQLHIHRDNPVFEACFTEITKKSMPSMVPVWSEIIGLKENSYLAGLVLQLSIENFLLQITDENLTEDWLCTYFDEIRRLVEQFKVNGSMPFLDGSV